MLVCPTSPRCETDREYASLFHVVQPPMQTQRDLNDANPRNSQGKLSRLTFYLCFLGNMHVRGCGNCWFCYTIRTGININSVLGLVFFLAMVQFRARLASRRTARACRNSLLWYNVLIGEFLVLRLGLVGIPCYGTMSFVVSFVTCELGLVGIPCYGTMRLVRTLATGLLGLVGIPCYGTIVPCVVSYDGARACRNSLLWYNFLGFIVGDQEARACRNSLLWYNSKPQTRRSTRLGLVGIPCYGTIKNGVPLNGFC